MSTSLDFHPYLNFRGNCAEAFRFYEQTLGGKIVAMQTHGESPMKDQVAADWHDAVIHACLEVNGRLLMGSDAPPDHFRPAQGLWVNITVASTDEARRLFKALAEGGTVSMPFEETFWSPGFGMLTDRFGTPWMVNTLTS